MFFATENEYSAVLDACVLVPMALCDILLRLAEEPALYRPLWSEQILSEVAQTLQSQLRKTREQTAWRLAAMRQAFPQAMVSVPPELLGATDCIPDEDDRHVLAAALSARADVIVTQNIKHFPADCLARFGVASQTPDQFLIDRYYISPEIFLDKLDEQAAGIAQDRTVVIKNLRLCAPGLCELLRKR